MREASHKSRHYAAVLGLGVNGYGIVRSMARAGIPAFGFYSSRVEFARYSRRCRSVPWDGGRELDERACNTLVQWASTLTEKPVLFPTSDRYVQFVNRFRDRLSAYFLYHWQPEAKSAALIDKAAMHKACHEAGILAPRTWVTTAEADVESAACEFSFPVIVKPTKSFDTPFPSHLKNYVAQSAEALVEFYRQYPALKGASLWQEIIGGADDCVFQFTAVRGTAGELLGSVCVRKLRQYLPGFGIMCFGRTEANATVSDEAGKLLRHLRYEGVASIEFKLCPSDGQYYFIEMNPRLPWYNSLFCDSGDNLALLSYADLTGSGAGEAQAAPREGVHWLAMQEDLGWLARSQTRRLDQVARWFCSVLRARSFAWWTLRDPLPGMYAALSFVMAAGAGILERCRLWRKKPIRERTAESGHLTTASTALCKEK